MADSRPSMEGEEWEVIRERIISETEAFLNDGLAHPEKAVVIPTMAVGSGTFSKTFAEAF